MESLHRKKLKGCSQQPGNSRRTTGSAILELVVALGVGVILYEAIFSVILKGITVLKDFSEIQRAYVLVENQMEFLHCSPSVRLEDGLFPFSETFRGEIDHFRKAESTITVSPWSGNTNLKRIEVCLKWENGKNIEKKVSLVTLER
jgi:hypothetical protein